jgi:hypothetical protein
LRWPPPGRFSISSARFDMCRIMVNQPWVFRGLVRNPT